MTVAESLVNFRRKLINFILWPAYKVYLWRLTSQVSRYPPPRHMGLILDGNRRWAKARGMPESAGHREGYRKAKEVLDWCWDQKVRTVTVYALSLDNMFRRKQDEVDGLIGLVDAALTELAEDPRIMERGVRVRVIGRREVLPRNIIEKATELERKTASNTEFLLLLAVGYSGRAEIVDAIRRIVRDVEKGAISPEEIDEEKISSYLYTAGTDDPDLILRTGGESRLSNFLPWQAIYSEFVFIDVQWPGFRKIDFLRTIRTYQQKTRRYGS
ncbi:MAG: polyprenyl diphosphate synthase [Thermoprotei archaeon]